MQLNNNDKHLPVWPMFAMFTTGGILLSIPKMINKVEEQISQVAGTED